MLNLRQLFTPVQPTVNQSTEGVIYREFLPDERLQPFIYSYWELKSTQALDSEFKYKVVADGCIDIFFDLGHPNDNFIMGFCKHYTEFSLEKSFHYIGIRFLPTMLPQLFKVDASQLSNHFFDLADIMPGTASFIANRFDPSADIEHITKLLDLHFTSLLIKADLVNDNRLYEAIDIILKNSGTINVETQLNTGISPRQLRRLFNFYIGDSAKAFASIVRFQTILRAQPSSTSLRQHKLFYDAGYYDQAHFIKEFKTFYGTTPRKAFVE